MVHFVGAGSGDPELITVKGARLLKNCRYSYIYRFTYKIQNFWIIAHRLKKYNSAYMDLEQVAQVYKENPDKDIVRLHTGDPCFWCNKGANGYT